MKRFLLLFLMSYSISTVFAQFEQIDSIIESYNRDKKCIMIVSMLYSPPAELYMNDTLYYMSRSPLAYIDKTKYKNIYPLWDIIEETSFSNYSYHGNYDCVWKISGDSLFLCKIRKYTKEIYSPYTYDDVKKRMENFTGYKFDINEKMFAAWLTGSFYIMPPYDKTTYNFSTLDEFAAAEKEWAMEKLRKLTFKNGKIISIDRIE